MRKCEFTHGPLYFSLIERDSHECACVDNAVGYRIGLCLDRLRWRGSDSSGNGGNGGGGGSTSYTVTPSVSGSGGTINPSSAVSVQSGATASFTLTPNTGYTATVGGTCGGTLNGNTYTTDPVTANCTVVASFAAPSTGASVAACYTVPQDISYMLDPNQWSIPNFYSKISITQSTFNGQTATTETMYFKSTGDRGEITSGSSTSYWRVTPNGVVMLDLISNTETSSPDLTWTSAATTTYTPPIIIPLNIGQTITQSYTSNTSSHNVYSNQATPVDLQQTDTLTVSGTLIGFETITLAGKTFFNVCHFKGHTLVADGVSEPDTTYDEEWIAPGYGTIKEVYHDADGDFLGWQYGGPSS